MKARYHVVFALVGVAAALVVGWITRSEPSASRPSAEDAAVDATHPAPSRAVPATEATFTRAPRQLVRQRDLKPSDPGYDAIQLGVEAEMTPKEIFDAEPRDERFAANQEQLLRQTFADVFERLAVTDSIRGISVECRTLSCEATVMIGRDDTASAYDALNGIPFAPVVEVNSPTDSAEAETRAMTFALLFKPGHRDPRAFQQWQTNVLWPRVERIQQRTQ
jgi:hypothetical protein